MKAKPTVYVLCGFIGAGKTTFARELEARTGAVRITKDEWLVHPGEVLRSGTPARGCTLPHR